MGFFSKAYFWQVYAISFDFNYQCLFSEQNFPVKELIHFSGKVYDKSIWKKFYMEKIF